MTLDLAQAYDFIMTALALWREARGASNESKRGVCWVIRNRALNPSWWGKGWAGVITQPFQFSSFNRPDPNATMFPSERNSQDWQAWAECLNIVQQVWEGTVKDPTNGATHFYSGSDMPEWAKKMTATAKIGPFAFYKERIP